ncbi:MAG: hypothetical protein OXE94_00230 [Aestuariivita sp.]|nr:hypothetical protein [Aestuariivita sp.]MCY4202104.1 hypothetical protein [Aestuariivita sp.]
MNFAGNFFRRWVAKTFVGSAITFLVACGGTMDGVVRGEGTPVTIQYAQGMVRDFYEMTVDGENFKGQAVPADARTGVGVGVGWAAGTTVSVVTSSTSGNVVAVMFGDQGATLRCNMNYAESSGFAAFGGVGICQHSDGRMIDIMW